MGCGVPSTNSVVWGSEAKRLGFRGGFRVYVVGIVVQGLGMSGRECYLSGQGRLSN